MCFFWGGGDEVKLDPALPLTVSNRLFPLSPYIIAYRHAVFYFLIYYIITYNGNLQDFSGDLKN